ncbi:helix-turn-helix domain-containing protein [Arthrobacter sp. ok362]|uniref:helix-turn-helix domain-containing protein n=1 Tax=Arthrobacter sp. ok362 TaxID=1761745 RepID=UPI0015882893|nr:helix-turn-helix domain-containing protein [Arthrobacter sp. ok362]
MRSRSASAIRDSVNALTADEHLLVPHQGTLDGTVNGLRARAVSLVFVAYGSGVTIVSPPSGRRVLVVIPLGPMLVESCGNQWVANTPFALSSHHQTKMVPDPQRGALVGGVDAESLESYLVATSNRPLVKPISLKSSVPLQLSTPLMVTQTWLEACRQLDQGLPAESAPWLENILLATLSAGMAPFLEASFAPLPTKGGPGYVEQACRYLQQHLSENVRIDDVAAAVGISTRQLHAAFQDHIGRSPAQVLRDMRLARVRQRLEARGGPKDITVAGVANDAGFAHLGRFSAYYTEKYQESPSTTLQRLRGGAARPPLTTT